MNAECINYKFYAKPLIDATELRYRFSFNWVNEWKIIDLFVIAQIRYL